MVKSPEANDNNQEALFEIAVPAQDTVSLVGSVGSVCLNKTVVDAASMHTVTTGPSKPSDADIARANTLIETGQINGTQYRKLKGEDDPMTPPTPGQPTPPNNTPIVTRKKRARRRGRPGLGEIGLGREYSDKKARDSYGDPKPELSPGTRETIKTLRETLVQQSDDRFAAELKEAGYSDETIARQIAALQTTRQSIKNKE